MQGGAMTWSMLGGLVPLLDQEFPRTTDPQPVKP